MITESTRFEVSASVYCFTNLARSVSLSCHGHALRRHDSDIFKFIVRPLTGICQWALIAFKFGGSLGQ
jgi:hypothetical protein